VNFDVDGLVVRRIGALGVFRGEPDAVAAAQLPDFPAWSSKTLNRFWPPMNP